MPALWASTGASGAAVGTATIAANTFTITAHGLVDGQTVVTSTPTGAAVGILVPGAPYYVASATANTFQLRPSPGGPVMVIASGGAVVDAAESVYDPQSLRQTQGGLLYKGRPSTYATGRFNARWGVLQNSSTAEVSVSGLTVTVQDLNCVVQTSGSTTRGGYLVAIPSSQHLLATAHASLTRVDLLVAEVLDTVADASGDLIPGRTRIIQGTPGSGAPGVPNGSLEIATFSIPAASGTATPTVVAPFTVAAGGILPVRTAAELPSSVLREAMYADQADTDTTVRYSGSAWQGIASVANFNYVQALTGGAAVTGPTAYTPTIAGQGTATFSTLIGRWQRIAPGLVWWHVFMQVGTAGSGTSVLQVTSPTNPSRVTRQSVQLTTSDGSVSPAARSGSVYTFQTGTGATWDRFAWDNGGSANGLENMDGSKLTANMRIFLQGVYWEA